MKQAWLAPGLTPAISAVRADELSHIARRIDPVIKPGKRVK